MNLITLAGRSKRASSIISPYVAGWNGADDSFTLDYTDPFSLVVKHCRYAVWRGANVVDGTPAPIMVGCHGANESGFNISTVLNATMFFNDLTNNTANLQTVFADWYVIAPQQPALDGSESNPSKNQSNAYRIGIFEGALAQVRSVVNYNAKRMSWLGFSGGGNWVLNQLYRYPGVFASGSHYEGNGEWAKVSLDSATSQAAGNALLATVLLANASKLWQHNNDNDTNVTVTNNGGGRTLAAAFADPNFLTPNSTSTVPPYNGTSHRYVYTNGIYTYEESTTGGYPPGTSGSGTHDGVGLWRDPAWQTWVNQQTLP